MKKLLGIILTVCMILSVCAVPAFAEDTIKITVDGKVVDCAAYGQEPTAINGTTLVPLRSVFEELGATVAWDGDTQSVVSFKGDLSIILVLNSTEMVVGGEVKTLSVPAQSMNERIMVPVRAIAEAFGCDVKWNGDTRTVVISTLADSAETPEVIVANMYDTVMNLDFDALSKYFKNNDIIKSYLGAVSKEEFIGSISADEFDERTLELLLNFTSSALKLGTYSINDVQIDGDTAVVETTLSLPNTQALNAYDIPEEKLMDIYVEALAKCGLTMEDLEKEEVVSNPAIAMEFTYTIYELSLDYGLEIIAEDVKNGKIVAENETIMLEKINGRWIISEIY